MPARGCPAAGMPIELSIQQPDGSWQRLGGGTTNDDGRVHTLLPEGRDLGPGIYRMRFECGVYHAALDITGFYPLVDVRFQIVDPDQHYHVPLLVSPFGFSTYRGS